MKKVNDVFNFNKEISLDKFLYNFKELTRQRRNRLKDLLKIKEKMQEFIQSQEEKISNLPIPELLSKTIDYLESFKTPTCEEHEYVDVDVEDLDSEKNYDFLKRNRVD